MDRTTTIPWLLIALSFALLAIFYNSLPPEILITRGFSGGEDLYAEKTLFLAFRAPLIDAISAAAATVIYHKFVVQAPGLARFWLILLYTAAFKALLQSIETITARSDATSMFYLTLVVVLGGIVWACFAIRTNFMGLFAAFGRFTLLESAVLVLLLVGYLAVAILPISIYG